MSRIARALPLQVGAALLASAEGYTPRANGLLDQAREDIGPIAEIANALADNLPAPKAPARKSRRRRRKKRAPETAVAEAELTGDVSPDSADPPEVAPDEAAA
jgi:hypothetical protein